MRILIITKIEWFRIFGLKIKKFGSEWHHKKWVIRVYFKKLIRLLSWHRGEPWIMHQFSYKILYALKELLGVTIDLGWLFGECWKETFDLWVIAFWLGVLLLLASTILTIKMERGPATIFKLVRPIPSIT